MLKYGLYHLPSSLIFVDNKILEHFETREVVVFEVLIESMKMPLSTFDLLIFSSSSLIFIGTRLRLYNKIESHIFICSIP